MCRVGRKNFFLITLACSMLLLPPAAFGKTIKVGVLVHLTGDLAYFGQMQKNSVLIALEDMQNQGDSLKNLELIYQNISTVPGEARTTVEKLIMEEKVVMLVGGISSATAWEAADVSQSHKIPFLITGSTEDKITEQGWEYVFRLNPPLSEYGNGLLWFLSEVVKPKTIAILRAKGFTGMLSSDEMIEYCRKAGYEVVFDYVYKEDLTDFRPVLRQVKDKNPDVISMASYLKDAVQIMRQCRELDINPLIFAGLGGGFTLPQFGEQAADVSNYVYSVSLWNPSVPYAGSKQYYEEYLRRYHTRPDFHGAEMYAAMQVLADTLHRATFIEPEGLRNTLVSTHVETIIGKIKFVSYGKKTQQNRLPTYLVQWIDGEMKTVWPPRLACQKYIFPFPGWKDH